MWVMMNRKKGRSGGQSDQKTKVPRVRQPDPPKGWGQDDLTDYWVAAQQNRWATFANHTKAFQRLIAVDRLFLTFAEGWNDPDDMDTPALAFRAHAAFRAAAQNATAGQVGDTFPTIRAAIEMAAYAVYLTFNPEAKKIWLHRSENEAARKAARRVFSHAKIERHIRGVDGWLAAFYSDLYEFSIDHGAHPNEQALALNRNIIKDGDVTLIRQMYLHGDGVPIRVAVTKVIEGGACALFLLRLAFPERFNGEQFGSLDRLKQEIERAHRYNRVAEAS